MSKSELSFMKKSPLHFFHRNELRKETEAMKIGTLLHSAILEPDKFKNSYIVEPDRMPSGEEINKRKKDDRAYLEAFRKDNADKLIVTQQQFDDLVGMITACSKNKDLIALVANGTPEVAGTWNVGDVKFKGKADYMLDHPQYGKTIIELKKTVDASEPGFSRQIHNYDYDLGAAIYLDGFEADTLIFIAVEAVFPFACGIWTADDSMISRGRFKYQKYLSQLAECNSTGVWHGYTKGIGNICLPAWVAGINEGEI